MLLTLWAGFSRIMVPYLSLILIIGMGILAAWWHILTPERITILSEIVTVFILPIFTFRNATTGTIMSVLNQAPWMVGLGLGGALVGYGIATVGSRMMHWDWSRRAVLQVSGVSGNTGFLGIPICTAIYGSQGAILALLYDFGASIYLFTLGIGAFQKNNQIQNSRRMQLQSLIKQFCSPLFIALILGLGLTLGGVKLPPIVQAPLESLSNIAIPMMLLCLGGLIYYSTHNHNVDTRNAILLGLLKLLIIPCLTWVAVKFLPLSAPSQAVAVIEAAMPSAITAVTFASRYNADENLASSATMLTTLVSIFTIPIFAAAF